ncbi:unnamed protein product [Xylocopa violacea]
MLDDLPHNFLKGHDIATIKQTATLNGFNSIKVKFLAGIIEHIDYNHDNPPIILKDFTDSIQGIIHRDIPIRYPGLLESNVVILLHDVGLLRISGTFVSNKYQVLISPSSLLAIYTNKGTVEHTQYIASVFRTISDGKRKMEEQEKESISATALKSHSSETNSQFCEKENHITKGLKKLNKNSTDANKKIVDKITEESMDFDSDISFSVSPTGITDSQNQKNFNNVTPMNLKYIIQENKKQSLQQSLVKKNDNLQENDDRERAKNLLKNLKRFTFDANEKKHISHNSKSLQANTTPSTPLHIHFKEVESKVMNDTVSREIDTENDSDDEMLSQLDMDTICSNYNAKN